MQGWWAYRYQTKGDRIDMEVERKAMICYCLGYIQGSLNNKASDAKLILDQKLIQMNQPVMTKEEIEYIKDLNDELGFTLMQFGVNRKSVRDIGMKKK